MFLTAAKERAIFTNRKIIIVPILLAMFLFIEGVQAREAIQWYGETQEQFRQRVFTQHLQIRYHFQSWPYGILGINHLSFPGKEQEADAAAHFFGEIGWRWEKDDWGKLFSGVRMKNYYGEKSSWQRQTPKVDWRILYVNGKYHEIFSRYFSETYGECLFTSADNNNLIASVFYRFGMIVYQKRWRWDFFTSPVIKLDRIGHFYYNMSSWEVMARVSWPFSHWIFSLYSGVSMDHYLQRRGRGDIEIEVNPYRQNKINGKILLTFGSR